MTEEGAQERNDGTDLYVNPKRKTAPPPAPDAKGKPVVGGAEELPGSPRPAKPGRSSIPQESDADLRRQAPGSVHEDAEVWDGKRWVRPNGEPVHGDASTNRAPRTGNDGAVGNPAGPTVESDDETEVVSTPRKLVSETPSTPLFAGATRPGGSKAGRGSDGHDFQEYQRPVTPDPAAKTFGLGGYITQDDGAPTHGSTSKGYVPLVPTADTKPVAKGGIEVWPPEPGGRSMIVGGAKPSSVPRASADKVHSPPLPPGALNVLLIGSGAREHAMALAIRRSSRAHLFVIPKHRNPGLTKSATGFKLLDDRDADGIVAWAKAQKIHLAVAGPESTLEAGVTDALRAAGIAVASPSQAAARIETSKTFMRELMSRHQVAGQLGFHPFSNMGAALAFLDLHGPVWAIKPVGLTGGKGVQVHGDHFQDVDGAKAYVRSIFAGNVGGGSVQFEELARGEEYTVMAFTDGTTVLPMPAVQDHKRLRDGDQGPNTGGMGSYSQADGLLPFLSQPEYTQSVRIMQGIVDALRNDRTPYVGTIYGQFMLTATGPKVIEVNARFGDPEAMNVLYTLESDYVAILEGMATGSLSGRAARFRNAATVVKYVVPKGYGEGTPTPGTHVEVDEFNVRRVKGMVFYGSIEQQPMGGLATLASRTLAVLGEGATIAEANAVCEAALRHVTGRDLFVRHDIGSDALIAQRVRHMAALRRAAAEGAPGAHDAPMASNGPVA